MNQGLTALYLFIIILIWGTNYPLMQLAFVDVAPLAFAVMYRATMYLSDTGNYLG